MASATHALFVIWTCTLFYVYVDTTISTEVINGEYCTSETFEPECPEGNVIFIEHATYGRMHAGKCITDEYGVGCQADVTAHLADKCSGRTHCSTLVGTLDSIAQPCGKDLKSFLQATHRCIYVKYARPCNIGEKSIALTEPHGFIAPYADTTYVLQGVNLCSWEIRGQPGQRINITVNNLFKPHSDASIYTHNVPCPVKLTITEKGVLKSGNIERTYELCQDNNPRLLYTSKNNVIYLQIPFNARKMDVVQKLLKYEVYGCPNILPSRGSYVRRDGDNVIAVVCNATMETWYLTCKEGEWVGLPGNCSVPPPLPEAQFKHGITLAIIVGVALGTFMGACMLCLVYVMRKSGRRNHAQRESHYAADIQYEPGLHSGTITATATLTTSDRSENQQNPQQQIQQSLIPGVMCQTKQHRETGLMEYTHVWGVHPPSICTERQYSSSTFSPTYDHRNSCIPLQNYDSSANTSAANVPLPVSAPPAQNMTPAQQAQQQSQQQDSGGVKSISINSKSNTCIATINNSNHNNNDTQPRPGDSISSSNLLNINNTIIHEENLVHSPMNTKRTFFCELHGNV